LATTAEIKTAFDAAIAQTRKSLRAGMKTIGGESAAAHLEKLQQELTVERTRALERGGVDREWFQKTVRELIEWAPETELSLVAALGRIARAAPTAPS
jgi:hypothetical protein